MRRALLPLLFASACSAAPKTTPPAPVPAPAPAITAPAAAARAPWLELTGTEAKTVLTGHDPDGRKLYEVPLGKLLAVTGAPDGGAFAVLQERDTWDAPRFVVHFDAGGREAWRVDMKRGGPRWHLFVVDPDGAGPDGGRVLAFEIGFNGKKHLHVFEAARGASVHDRELEMSDVDERAGVVIVADESGLTRLGPEGDPVWRVFVRRFPSLDPMAAANADRKVAVGLDGTVLSGASDGSLVALDAEGKPLYQLGVRGPVSRIEAQAGGGFVVHTKEGRVAVDRGVVREIAEATPEGARVVDRRKKQPASDLAPKPPWKPTVAYRASREGPAEGKPFHHVQSVAAAPGDVWVLGTGKPGPEDPHLFHHDGRAWSDLGEPSMSFPKEVFAEGAPASASRFLPLGLGRSPTGALLVLGVRAGRGAYRLSVIERVGAGFRERRELRDTLAQIRLGERTSPTYAASAGGREVLCDADPDVRTCVEFGRGLTPRILADDEGEGARGKADVWSVAGTTLTHGSGAAAEEHESPLRLHAVWASGRDDVWLTGVEGGVARFDGQRFWRILGIDGATRLSVTGSGRGDVWVFGEAGLWHVTPEPRAEADLEGTPSPLPNAAASSLVLSIAGPDPSYRLEPVVLDIDGERPLRSAVGIAEGPGGVVWLHEGARIVEYDGARARVLYQAPKPEPFFCWYAPEPDCNLCAQCTERKPRALDCQRCVAPAAKGEGVALAMEGGLSFQNGRSMPGTSPLAGLLAVAAGPSGAIWAVSAADDDLPRAMIQGPRGVRLVMGLPRAAYADVAVRADDEVWLAGGLTTGAAGGRTVPEGEGTLVRFDGRTFTRHRAPDGALLSVAAAGPGEAWAVGLAGGVLHVKGGVVEALHLTREDGARWPALLRGVAASGPNEVWIVGDGSTLLRWDGKGLRRVDASAAGREAALSAVIAPISSRPGWVVGPGGIWKVVPAR
ncbi:hypothetical protein [Polyangium spumosum]|uniref:WD40 repeat domain-containing protein n=1 Tax=Polyangium spumosum TaxID=889282 RepID=A0A6N7Q4D5_9BACT|nr:hypothetical protein [Polyangium spumosum]MRG97535.1 hypothetical protein [Polyangium spumosum]